MKMGCERTGVLSPRHCQIEARAAHAIRIFHGNGSKKTGHLCRPWRYPNVMEPQTAETDLPIYSEDGVDLTLIRWMLSLTPAERLQVLQESVCSILSMRANASKT